MYIYMYMYMHMHMYTISFLAFRFGPWNDLRIDSRAVPAEVEILKRAILVQIALL